MSRIPDYTKVALTTAVGAAPAANPAADEVWRTNEQIDVNLLYTAADTAKVVLNTTIDTEITILGVTFYLQALVQADPLSITRWHFSNLAADTVLNGYHRPPAGRASVLWLTVRGTRVMR